VGGTRLRSWPDIEEEETNIDLFGLEPAEQMGHPVVRATFCVDDGAVTLYANSRERIDAALHRWKERTGRVFVEGSVMAFSG
jgi:hypothetical protein